MGLKLFNSKKDEFTLDTDDILVVFNDDTTTADIVRVTEANNESVIAAGRYKVPFEDCEVATGPEGRIFFYRAPAKSVIETERLAKLEYNMVLNQITAYQPPIPPSSMDWTKGILFGLLFVALILVAF